jgi:hypothetical protein
MKITIEYYRIFIHSGLLLGLLYIICSFSTNIIIPNYVIVIAALFYGGGGSIIALTNLKKGYIEAYWKKENKLLKIPFQSNGHSFTALDEEGNDYRIGLLFIPKLLEKAEKSHE